ncbi:MAG TPA: hypothetical protein EYH30_05610 [Anaerolineales bacterium]|nr:hypothetical protein [Anaerolineae bacterium]HIQ01590.1 hypothetical protein [Anaerolineales bacterium]
MKNALRWLIGNLGLILLSFILAALVWIAAVEQGNPTLEDRYPSRIPVTLSNPPEEMIPYGETDVQVDVTLRAPQSVWEALEREDIHAMVDLSGLGPGEHRLPVQVQVDRRPAMVLEVEPEAITIRLEPLMEAAVPVTVPIRGDAALGYMPRSPVVSPLTVTVSGPASLVAQVVRAVAEVSVEGARADIEGEFALEPRDAEGRTVPHITLSPAQVIVHVPVEQLSGFRDLAVTALLEGQVASGYFISSVKVEPPVVTVYGRPDAIAQIPGYLETLPLNLDQAQENVEVQLPVAVPEGVSVLPSVVTVRVAVEALEGSLTIQRPVEIQGLAPSPEITATVAPTMVEVILSGPVPVLEQLREEDVRVIVDLFGLSPGSHSVEPQVAGLPMGVTAQSILPATVQVEISSEITPTPER